MLQLLRPLWTRPMETVTAVGPPRWGLGRGSLLLQGLGPASVWPLRGLWSSVRHSLQPVPGPCSSPAGRRAWRAPGEGRDPPLTALSAVRTIASLTVGGAGPLTAALSLACSVPVASLCPSEAGGGTLPSSPFYFLY